MPLGAVPTNTYTRARRRPIGSALRTVIATSFALTLDSGRARRTYGIARALAGMGPVDLVYGAFGGGNPDPEFAAVEDLSLHRIARPTRLSRLPAYVRA